MVVELIKKFMDLYTVNYRQQDYSGTVKEEGKETTKTKKCERVRFTKQSLTVTKHKKSFSSCPTVSVTRGGFSIVGRVEYWKRTPDLSQ